MLGYLTLKIDRLLYAMFNIAVPYNNSTKLPPNQTCASIRFWSRQKMHNVRICFIGKLTVYALFILGFILLEKLSWLKMDVRIKILKYYKPQKIKKKSQWRFPFQIQFTSGPLIHQLKYFEINVTILLNLKLLAKMLHFWCNLQNHIEHRFFAHITISVIFWKFSWVVRTMF